MENGKDSVDSPDRVLTNFMRGRLHITRLRVLMLITKKNANPEERGNTLRGSRSTMTSLATSVRFWMCL